MEKKLLYICVIALSAYLIFIKLFPEKSNQKKIVNFVLNEIVSVEDHNRGKSIYNIKLYDKQNQQANLYDTLSGFSSDYYLIIVSSIETCSTCRERVFQMWDSVQKKEKNLPIILVITENEFMSKKEIKRAKANLISLNIELPYYFEKEGTLLNELGVSPNQTPLSIILTRQNRIIALDMANNLTTDRTLHFKEFFLSLVLR